VGRCRIAGSSHPSRANSVELTFVRRLRTVVLPVERYPQLNSVLRRLQEMPPWALLSLVINGLLFLTVMVMLRQLVHINAGLPQANAYASDYAISPAASLEPQLGPRRKLNYQQWVSLLQAEAKAAVAINAPRQNILLGDSITLWFPAELLPGRKTWLNQAISGEKSAGLLNRLHLLDATDPEAVFIMVGINDMIWGGSDDTLLANVRAMVNYLHRAHPNANIVLQSILPHGGDQASWEGKAKLDAIPPSRIAAANASLKAIAAETGADYLDLYPLFVNGEGYLREDLTTDGLHLNHDGYMVWRTAIALYNETDFAP
jgi:lysophospholipase L1-like esterase